jgi:hypothetical protein
VTGRVYMVARFDVTSLTEEQRDRLATMVAVQAEENDDPDFYYPGVPEPAITFKERKPDLDVAIIDALTAAPQTARQIGEQIGSSSRAVAGRLRAMRRLGVASNVRVSTGWDGQRDTYWKEEA